MKTIRNRLLLLLAGVFLSLTINAQTGVICGNVSDAKLNEPLIGASVVISGTTTGVVTDLDGNFRIENVTPGTYAVSVSYYTSYKFPCYIALYAFYNALYALCVCYNVNYIEFYIFSYFN